MQLRRIGPRDKKKSLRPSPKANERFKITNSRMQDRKYKTLVAPSSSLKKNTFV